MDTPYQWTKQVASHWGGTRNGTIVHWPDGIEAKGEVRSQFSHVIDVAATVLDVAGIPAPTHVHGIQQMPLHGKTMAPSFDDADAPEHRETQYFEMFVNRGIYHKGWTAVTRHSIPWKPTEMPAYDDDVWELYSPDDWTQAQRSRGRGARPAGRAAAAVPDRGDALQRAAAGRSSVRALRPGHRRSAAADPGVSSQVLFGGMGQAVGELDPAAQEQVARGHRLDRGPRGRRERRDHRPGRRLRRLEPLPASRAGWPIATTRSAWRGPRSTAPTPVPAGEHQVRMEFTYDGGGLGKGGGRRALRRWDRGRHRARRFDGADGVLSG